MNYLSYFGDPTRWSGADGIPVRLLEHLGYVGLTMLISLVIAVPLGAWIGHTGRAGFLVVGTANGLRALPTLGVLVLLASYLGLGLTGPLISLVLLGVPPILAGTYAGVRNVAGDVVDAASGMGMRGRDVLFKVEMPNALPLILGGIRSSLLQVVSTATIAAVVGLGGLGRFIIDGLAVRDYSKMIAGAVLVALVAIAFDLLVAGLQKVIVSPGLQAPEVRRRTLRVVPDPQPAARAA